nr:bifunctional riboflavin biosynthesis protein RIBA 1, chloroplastic-like [Tanacetum cinerariifolium]
MQDAKHGTTTGVSASDRATTIKALASKESKPDDFNRPGHIFPLKYREGGVLKRAGHTEASVDLAVLAGFDPVAVLCEVVDDDGSMARLPKLKEFVKRENLKIISIADLISDMLDPIQDRSITGEIGDGKDILVRVHSECLTGDIFGSARCDCGNQLALAMQQIEDAGRGVLVYLRGHEGRGIGLGHKLRAYNLQDDGRDTVEANEELGLPILRDLGVRTMKLMTNNPAKYSGLKGYGLEILGRVPLSTTVTKHNRRYLETKRTKMGHVYGPGTNGVPNLINQNGEVTTSFKLRILHDSLDMGGASKRMGGCSIEYGNASHDVPQYFSIDWPKNMKMTTGMERMLRDQWFRTATEAAHARWATKSLLPVSLDIDILLQLVTLHCFKCNIEISRHELSSPLTLLYTRRQ